MKFFFRNKNAFISQLLVCSLVAIGFAGVSGVAVIWQRQLIVQTANRIKALESSIADIERHQTELTSQIASEQSFDALTRRNVAFNLGLVAVREQQIIRISEQPEQRLARKLNADIFTVAPANMQRAQRGSVVSNEAPGSNLFPRTTAASVQAQATSVSNAANTALAQIRFVSLTR